MKSNELENDSHNSMEFNQQIEIQAKPQNWLLDEISVGKTHISIEQNRTNDALESNNMCKNKTKSLTLVLDKICKSENYRSTMEKITTNSLDSKKMYKKQTGSHNLFLAKILTRRINNLLKENNNENAPEIDLLSNKNIETKTTLNAEKTQENTLVPVSGDFPQIPKTSNFLPAVNFSDSSKVALAGPECSRCKNCEEHTNYIRYLINIIDSQQLERREIIKNSTKVGSSTVSPANSEVLNLQSCDVQESNNAVYSSVASNRLDIETPSGSMEHAGMSLETNFISDITIIGKETLIKNPIDIDRSKGIETQIKHQICIDDSEDDSVNEDFEILNPLNLEEEAELQHQRPPLHQPKNSNKFRLFKNIMTKIPNKIKEIKKKKVPTATLR